MRETSWAALLVAVGIGFTAGGCSSGDGPSCTPSAEVCNGQDDDCDEVVDEGCACVDGATQACFTGPPERRGVGICTDGVATCAQGQWGGCAGDEPGLASEICGNGLDDDCDGVADQREWDWELCGNGLDDDCDGLTDERDPDLVSSCWLDAWNHLGYLSGDEGSDLLGTMGGNHRWLWVTFTEDNSQLFGKELHGTVELRNLPNVDFDVRVYCMECGGRLVVESSAGPGQTDVVNFFANDDWGSNDWFHVVIEVFRKDDNPVCGLWEMWVKGNLDPGGHWNNVCDRPH